MAVELITFQHSGSGSSMKPQAMRCHRLNRFDGVKIGRRDQTFLVFRLWYLQHRTVPMKDSQQLSTGMLIAEHMQKVPDPLDLDDQLEKALKSVIHLAASSQK